MTGEAYAVAAARAARHETKNHETIAMALARGDIPPESEWTWQQRTAVQAFLDGQAEPHSVYRTKVTKLGNGHVEGMACKVWLNPWRELCRWAFPDRTERGEGDRERNAQDAAKRAKTRVRQLCKAMGVNSLGTLTYRQKVTDRAQVLRHWKAFIRKVRKVLPSFAYVATLEKQDRGAYHVHFGMRKLPAWVRYVDEATGRWCMVKSWTFMRAIWLRTIKADGLDGNFDESAKLGRGDRARVMRIAAYIGKYVGKEFADESQLNCKRYFHSEEAAPIRPVVATHYAATFADLIARLYADMPGELLDFGTCLKPGREFFWYSAHASPM